MRSIPSEGVIEMSIREKRGVKRSICNTAVLLLIGMFVFAQQVSSESIFDGRDALPRHDAVLDSPDLSARDSVVTAADTMEVYDLMYDEDEGRNLYKEIAMFTILAAIVVYMVVTLIQPDEEEVQTDGGKEPPITPAVSVSIPLNR